MLRKPVLPPRTAAGGSKTISGRYSSRSRRIFVVKGGRAPAEPFYARGRRACRGGRLAKPSIITVPPTASLTGFAQKTREIGGDNRRHAAAPWEPALPGVRKELKQPRRVLGLGKAIGGRWEIRALTEKRTALWRMTYRWLAGCLDMCEAIKSVGAACLDSGALRAGAEVLAGVPDGEKWSLRRRRLGGQHGR